ncbi:MAG: glycosyltransferase [Bacillota bacterium]|nr:MAG: glycosyltransferase [Bacillota bacterium]
MLFATNTTSLLLFWAIWLLVPLMVDGLAAVLQLISIWMGESARGRRIRAELREAGAPSPNGGRGRLDRRRSLLPPLERFPLVTVVIPIYNGSHTLGRTLASLVGQEYPLSSMEVICVDNGSTDDCFDVFARFQDEHPELRLAWISIERPGKAAALNAGIYSSVGEYLLAVDADVSLAPDAVYEMVRNFEYRPRLAAATGAIAVSRVKRQASPLMRILHVCEAFEYLSAFRVGRRYQSLVNSLYTLSGAFSAFRRESLLEDSYLYDSLTVSEDTKLTFDLRDRIRRRRPGATLECVDSAVAYVEPIPSLAALYSQRLRWQRGQVEVTALHSDEQAGVTGPFRNTSGRILLADHTLAFPRLVWTFLLPFLFLIGYSPAVVLMAVVAMYVAYILIEILFFLAAYQYVGPSDRAWLRAIAWIVVVMPPFRFMIYWFRLAGILHAVAEPQRWHTYPLRSDMKTDRSGRHTRTPTVGTGRTG